MEERKKDVLILAIETSCDETAAAVVKNGREVLSNTIYTQIKLHTMFGGVVPEIASRKHIEKINIVIETALKEADVTIEDNDANAVTYGPGIVGALLLGVAEAKALAYAAKKPLVGVHHIEGHISANYIEHKELEPPFLCMVASGGHSHLVLVKGYGEYEIIGRTRDDAAGEAFDKVARAIGLGYPGGPKIDKLAKEGNKKSIAFPRAKITDAPDAKICPPCKGNITFDNVSFAYADGRPVIRNLSLSVAAGETVAFVGATGAGKTTIASLLLRFYEPQSGRILLDGCDIREFTQESLRRQIGLVQQDVFLFGDSVRYNIAYAKPDATADEVQAAAKAAAADEFIQKLPAGYDTEVGERGVKLSGGQKQRLAIARVFLKNPPVVVLDEATSALDNITEQQIQKELDELAVGRTTLIIAHRLSTIRHADKIVVLDEGAVAECGSHEELLARKGHYYDLYQKD